ncbi:hypothetical protein Mapa_017549 [Marchantia paleacea]|nr:hypothetical protein Mapa_017549 [Marchantia paleacea]
MEEEKAAAYYDELVRKGGNAAKYKQGLGFGTSQTSLPKSEAYGSLSNFVKSSPGRTAALEKEVRLHGIRDKLKKSEDDYSSRKRSPDRDRTRDDDQVEDGDRSRRRRRRRKTPDLQVEDRKREKHSHRSICSEGNDRGTLQKAGSDRKRRSRSRSRRRSVAPEKILVSKKRELQQRISRSPSHGSSGTSSERAKKRSRRSKRDRSTSPRVDSRSKQRRTPEKSSRICRSRSKSKERRIRDRSRSRSRGRDADRSYRRDGSYSPQRSRRGRRSRSPTSHRSFHRNRDSRYGERISDRADSHRTDCNRGRYDDEKRHRSARDRIGRAEEKIPQRDYSKLITNFESMTPAEKVKAKMKLQLSETVVKDKAKGMSDEWERFDFNKDAPLDDDAKQDYFGDGTGARDDTVFLKNTGSTFLSSSNQVTREAQVQSAHDNAIFGPPQGLRIRVSHPEIHPVVERNDHDDESDEQPMIVEEAKVSLKDESPKRSSMGSTPPVSIVVSQQVIAMQQAGSWQERARKMREARGALDL